MPMVVAGAVWYIVVVVCLGLFVGACFLGGEGVLDRGFVAVSFIDCRGDARGWLDV